MRKLGVSIAALTLLFGIANSMAAETVSPDISAALKNFGRPQLDLYRDAKLKPGEVLSFGGMKPGMVVAEILPGNGYWSRILSGIVGSKGAVYMVIPMGRGGQGRGGAGGPLSKDPNQNEEYNRVQVANAVEYQPEFKNLTVYWEQIGQQLGLPKQLDAVLLANDYHVLKSEFAQMNMVEVNKGIFRAMKNGGLYLVMDAAADKGSGFASAAMQLGRSDPDAVKAEIVSAGFAFDGESNVLSRVNDARHAAADDMSDMFVLRFKKPLNAPDTNKRPKNIEQAMAGYYSYTRRSSPGLIRKGGKGDRERRLMFHTDMTYQEWGQQGSGDNPWQSGIYYFGADGDGCMLHLFPLDQKAFTVCNPGMAPPGKKPGDMWFDAGVIREFVGPGYDQFPDAVAKEGATLGKTPDEVARAFGKMYGFAEKSGASKDYLGQYLSAYESYRADTKVPAAQLDTEFEKSYGKPVPTLPTAQD